MHLQRTKHQSLSCVVAGETGMKQFILIDLREPEYVPESGI